MNGYMIIPIEIIVVFLSALLGGIGWIIVSVLNALKKNTDAINSINESIQDIRLWISKKDTADVYEEKECQLIHKSINSRFDNHEKRITNLESK